MNLLELSVRSELYRLDQSRLEQPAEIIKLQIHSYKETRVDRIDYEYDVREERGI